MKLDKKSKISEKKIIFSQVQWYEMGFIGT